MSIRAVSLVSATVAALALLTAYPAAQAPTASSGAAAASNWVPAKTLDGQPDIQGMWINYDPTPFEVPLPTAARGGGGGGGVGPSTDFDDTAPRRVPRRRSMVVDPPSGRVPVLPWAEAKRADDLAKIQDHWVHQTPWDRCITRGGSPGGMFPGAYGNGYRIVQSRGTVAILYEMIHELRIIHVDGRPPISPKIRQWNGDSRGRWEGNTLVVNVGNYHDRGTIASNAASGRIRGIPHTADLQVVERFTIVDKDTLNYRVTITDPKVYSSPWTVEMPLIRDDSYQMFEYACHEGNRAMPNTLSAGRALEKQQK
ncbi:MAG: hypothetical protein FJW27_06665 [Acidimicrobiia bacterium]|nr:hypothetical protein [Acidimicrobiia bacterium]